MFYCEALLLKDLQLSRNQLWSFPESAHQLDKIWLGANKEEIQKNKKMIQKKKTKTKSKFKNTFLYLPSQNGSEHWGHTAPLPLKLRLTCPELCFSCIPSPKFISKPCLCGDPQKDIYMRFGTGIEYFQKSEEWLTNSCVTETSQ